MIEQLQDRASGRLADGNRRYKAPAGRPKAARWLGRAAEALAGLVYPPSCPGCRSEIAERGGVCPECWRGISFISPPACGLCGAPVPVGLGLDPVCDSCAHAPPAWSRGAAAILYEGVGRSLVLGLKHGDRLEVAPLAARWMAGAGAPLLAAADLIAPVPLHWRRMIKRRYNQAGELAREVAKAAGRPEAATLDLLVRTRRTPTQEGRSRGERFANVSGVIAVPPRRRALIEGRRVLLIDDVLTTGATLSACAEACREAGAADVAMLAFARVARPDWSE